MSIKKIGIMRKQKSDKAIKVTQEITKWLTERNIEVYLDVDLSQQIGLGKPCQRGKMPDISDMIIVIGGDGTLIGAARLVVGRELPILGINVGGLGFLTEISLDEIYITLEKILANDFKVEPRMMLTAYIYRQDEKIADYTVLNDVVINKGALARIISIHVYIDDQYLSTFKADGLIFSTPTGSTAYSLSAGGPIVMPELSAIIIAPICPHTLTQRPILIKDTSKIKAILDSKDNEVVLTLDGQVGFALNNNDEIVIEKAEKCINLIRSPFKNPFEILRTKLRWGENPGEKKE